MKGACGACTGTADSYLTSNDLIAFTLSRSHHSKGALGLCHGRQGSRFVYWQGSARLCCRSTR